MTPLRDHNSLKGHSNKRAPARGRGADALKLIEWQVLDEKSYRLARVINFSLGRLPQRLAKFGKAHFDLEEDREYGAGDGETMAGRDLAGLAAYLVRCAVKPPIDYLRALRGIPARFAAPMKTYLRVKLALGRLTAEIETVKQNAPSMPPRRAVIPAFATTGSDAGVNIEQSAPDDARKPKSYTWDVSPAKAYGFKDMSAEFGYDPRGTSAYWIEQRANALRRKWKAYGQSQCGERRAFTVKSAPKIVGGLKTAEDESSAAVRHFQPADADYNTVWPPVKLPEGPPKISPITKPETAPRSTVIPKFSQQISGTLQGQGSVAARENDRCAFAESSPKRAWLDTSQTPPRSRMFSDENSGMTVEGGDAEGRKLRNAELAVSYEDTEDLSQTYQNTAPISAKFQAVLDAAAAARIAADAAGHGLSPPPGYLEMFGGGPVNSKKDEIMKADDINFRHKGAGDDGP